MAADAPSLEKLECGSSSPRSQPWQSPQARAGDDARGEVGAFISPAAGAGKNSPAFGHRSSSPCPRFLIISADLAQAPSTPHGPLPSLQPRLCPWQALGGAAKPSHRRCWDGRTGCVTSDISLQEGQGRVGVCCGQAGLLKVSQRHQGGKERMKTFPKNHQGCWDETGRAASPQAPAPHGSPAQGRGSLVVPAQGRGALQRPAPVPGSNLSLLQQTPLSKGLC